VPFHEFFHGESGAGHGASHQTGWTALVGLLLQYRGDLCFDGSVDSPCAGAGEADGRSNDRARVPTGQERPKPAVEGARQTTFANEVV